MQFAAFNQKLSDILSFQGLFHGQPISKATWLQQMEDMEDGDWQSRDMMTKKAPSSVPAIDFSSEVSAWYGNSQGRLATNASGLLAWER